MTTQQKSAIEQAISNLKAVVAAQVPTATASSVNLNLVGDGAYSFSVQTPSIVTGRSNSEAYSGPAAELPAAQ